MRLFLILWLCLAPPALGQDGARFIAFSEGRYTDAVALAETEMSADALAFSARSLLAEAMSVSDFDPPIENVEAAEALARKALEMDPSHIEGRLQLAIALSLRARPLSNREALRAGHGEEAKDLVDSVLRDDPENLYANGFLAVWHVEVRRRGGAIGASFMAPQSRTDAFTMQMPLRLIQAMLQPIGNMLERSARSMPRNIEMRLSSRWRQPLLHRSTQN